MTLVPDDPSQATSDHGWDFRANRERLTAVCRRLKAAASVFRSLPTRSGVRRWRSPRGRGDRIVLYTGPYGGALTIRQGERRLLPNSAKRQRWPFELGLGVNAGHDLTVDNLPLLAQHIPMLAEVSIGHGLTADALVYGMPETVRRYRRRACGEAI